MFNQWKSRFTVSTGVLHALLEPSARTGRAALDGRDEPVHADGWEDGLYLVDKFVKKGQGKGVVDYAGVLAVPAGEACNVTCELPLLEVGEAGEGVDGVVEAAWSDGSLVREPNEEPQQVGREEAGYLVVAALVGDGHAETGRTG